MQDSLAKGTFLSIPSGFSISKARKRKLESGVTEDRKIWESAFLEEWTTLDDLFQKRHEEVYNKIQINQIKSYLDSFPLDGTQELIRCDLMLTGLNVPDRSLLFDHLRKALKKDLTSYYAILWAKDCATQNNALHQFIKQIIPIKTSKSRIDDSSDEDEIVENKPSNTVNLANYQISMPILVHWYSAQTKATKTKPPIVLVIADFESFEPTILNNLIKHLGAYSSSIPFLLVVGVATTSALVYQTLQPDVTSLLNFHEIHCEPSPKFLDTIIEDILFVDKCPFRLGGRVMPFLIDNFLFNSFSVKLFIHGFKYCMLEHYYEKDHFALCCTNDNLPDRVNNLTHEHIEQIRRLLSFQRHVEQCQLSERKLLLLDDDHTKKFVLEKIMDLHCCLSDFHLALKCLQIFTFDLPGSPLGRFLREYYCLAVSTNICDNEDYHKCLNLLGTLSRTEMEAKVNQVIKVLTTDAIISILEKGSNRFDDVIAEFEKYLSDMKGLDESQNTNENQTSGISFTELRAQVILLLNEKLIRIFLQPITSFTLHEIILFDDVNAVKRRLNGNSRNSIHLALNNPQHYLECDCCKLEELENIVPSMPDISIAYKVHLECGKTIHTGDWLQSFAEIIEPGKSKIDQQIKARFTRAVSELQYLGFIKPSKGKTDRVIRQTFISF